MVEHNKQLEQTKPIVMVFASSIRKGIVIRSVCDKKL